MITVDQTAPTTIVNLTFADAAGSPGPFRQGTVVTVTAVLAENPTDLFTDLESRVRDTHRWHPALGRPDQCGWNDLHGNPDRPGRKRDRPALPRGDRHRREPNRLVQRPATHLVRGIRRHLVDGWNRLRDGQRLRGFHLGAPRAVDLVSNLFGTLAEA
ncbi:MAG: hypothetical protein EBS94_17440, partial [Proteobacteria bacterium]|nr:hypothetical protein [Pseudomonadota bacterium]